MPEILACARCGYSDLERPGIGSRDFITPGNIAAQGTRICTECGFQGLPLIFDREEDWRAFRDERKGVES